MIVLSWSVTIWSTSPGFVIDWSSMWSWPAAAASCCNDVKMNRIRDVRINIANHFSHNTMHATERRSISRWEMLDKRSVDNLRKRRDEWSQITESSTGSPSYEWLRLHVMYRLCVRWLLATDNWRQQTQRVPCSLRWLHTLHLPPVLLACETDRCIDVHSNIFAVLVCSIFAY